MKRAKTVPEHQPRTRSLSARTWWLLGGGLVFLVGIVYWPTLANGFVWDDDDYVENNQTLTSSSGLRDIWFKPGAVPQYYPLTHGVFWIEHRLWGLDPRGYHMVNLLLHAISAVLAWRLLVRLAVPGAWLAAAIFAVHPVCVESVAWVTELKNVLSCALALGSMLAYLRFSPAEIDPDDGATALVRGWWPYYAVSFVLYAAAVLSKTVVASVPAVLLVVYWWKRGQFSLREFARLVPFFAFGLALSAVTIWMEKTSVGATGQEWALAPLDRILIAGRALWFYAGKLAWPQPLIFFYPRWTIDARDPAEYLFPLAALITVIGLWWARGRLGRGALAAVLIFAGVLVPALGFFDVFPFRYSFVADHFQYHASIALIALAAAAASEGVSRLGKRTSWLLPVIAIFVLAPLSVVARERTHVFKDRATLHEDTFAQNPTAWVAPLDLGQVEFARGNFDRAIAHDQRAIDVLEKIAGQNPVLADTLAGSYVNLGFVQQRAGRLNDAEANFGKSVALREKLVADSPSVIDFRIGLAWSYSDLALAQRAMNKTAEAEANFEKVVAIREKIAADNPAVGEYQDVLAGTYVELALLQRSVRRRTDAAASFQKAILVREKLIRDPRALDAWKNNLAGSFFELGQMQTEMVQPAQAEASFRKAIELREALVSRHPAEANVQSALAWSYTHCAIIQQNTAQRVEAEAAYRKAIAIRQKLASDYPAVDDYKIQTATSYIDLGIVQREMGREAEAVDSFAKALGFQRQLVDAHPGESQFLEELAASYTDIGQLERKMKRFGDAERSFLAAAQIRERLVRANPTVARNRVALAWSDAHLAAVMRDLGSAQSGAFSDRALKLREQLVREHPSEADYRADLASSYASRGTALMEIGQTAEAIASSQQAIEILAKLVQENPTASDYRPAAIDYQSRLGSSYANLGKVQLASGQLPEAEFSYREAVNIRAKLVQENPTVDDYKDEIATSCRDLGNVYRAMKRVTEAVALYQAAVEIRGSMAAADPTKIDRQSAYIDDLVLCGDALAALGDWPEAAEKFGSATGIGPDQVTTTLRAALGHLAAGDEEAYRNACAKLAAKIGNDLPPDDVPAIVLTLVAGEKALSDMEQVVSLANRGDIGSDPVARVLLGSAQFRAGHLAAAVALLEKALPHIEQSTSSVLTDGAWVPVGRSLGSLLLARARVEQNGEQGDAPWQVVSDQADHADLLLPDDQDGLPPWIVPCMIEIVKREMAKVRAPADAER